MRSYRFPEVAKAPSWWTAQFSLEDNFFFHDVKHRVYKRGLTDDALNKATEAYLARIRRMQFNKDRDVLLTQRVRDLRNQLFYGSQELAQLDPRGFEEHLRDVTKVNLGGVVRVPKHKRKINRD